MHNTNNSLSLKFNRAVNDWLQRKYHLFKDPQNPDVPYTFKSTEGAGNPYFMITCPLFGVVIGSFLATVALITQNYVGVLPALSGPIGFGAWLGSGTADIYEETTLDHKLRPEKLVEWAREHPDILTRRAAWYGKARRAYTMLGVTCAATFVVSGIHALKDGPNHTTRNTASKVEYSKNVTQVAP